MQTHPQKDSLTGETQQVCTQPEMGFGFQYPAHWELTENWSEDRRLLQVRLKEPRPEAEAEAAMIEIQAERLSDDTLVTLEDFLLRELTPLRVSGQYTVTDESFTRVHGLAAQFLTLKDTWRGETAPAQTLLRYYLVNNGFTYILTCSCPDARLNAVRPIFDALINAFSLEVE